MNETLITIILTIIFAPILLAFYYRTDKGKKDLEDLKNASEELKSLTGKQNNSDSNKNSFKKEELDD
tara:strand:- start:1157 stop:1357 length:201 start_codon:yes stop_codon:yes gene_type:complete